MVAGISAAGLTNARALRYASAMRRAAWKPRRLSADPPADRPLASRADAELRRALDAALAARDGATGAHCIHELWMRGEMSLNVERALAALWARAAATVPEWLPMRYVERMPEIYEICSSFRAADSGHSNIYLVLLDYRDSRPEPHGFYVGMSQYSPAERFDQHKAGIRAAGCVLRRGVEVLTGPTLHLQYIQRREAVRIEERLAEALTAAGFFVQGGH
jgi:hypothetical protein